MDRLGKADIEAALEALLPECKVRCTLSVDGTASLMISCPGDEAFAVAGLVRGQYRGEEGLKRLAAQILEDLRLARRRSHALPA
jgi:hypothetical protein